MCGIFGAFRAGGDQPLALGFLRNLGLKQLDRGKHAWGVSWMDVHGRVFAFKDSGPLPRDWIDIIPEDALAVIGHTRWATHGDVGSNINNHPHPCDGGWLVHNGVVRGHEEIAEENFLSLMSDCDSEVIARLIEMGGRSLSRRIVTAINQTQTSDPLAVAGLWGRPCRVSIARRGNPMVTLNAASGNVYFGSLAIASKRGTFKEFPNGRVKVWDLNSGRSSLSSVRTPLKGKVRRVLGSSDFGGGAESVRGLWADDFDDTEDSKFNSIGGCTPMSADEVESFKAPTPKTEKGRKRRERKALKGGGFVEFDKATKTIPRNDKRRRG